MRIQVFYLLRVRGSERQGFALETSLLFILLLYLSLVQSIDVYYSSSSGSGNVVIASVTCNGSEFRLTDCEYDDDTDGYSNSRDWYTYCRVG